MLQYFVLPAGTSAAVCAHSHSLRHSVAFISGTTLQQAQHQAARRNLKSAQRLAELPQQSRAKFRYSPARFFESEVA